MILETIASALNVRTAANGPIIGELRLGDQVKCADPNDEWVKIEAITGHNAGLEGTVRRKWLIQWFETMPEFDAIDRRIAGDIVSALSEELDSVQYRLGANENTIEAVRKTGLVDCSGWVYLVGSRLLREHDKKTSNGIISSKSDKQIVKVGTATGKIISGRFLQHSHFVPGVLVGIDFSEYSWDRGRPLDIDHIGIIGKRNGELIFSQSSHSGGGVNTVKLSKWLGSQSGLIAAGRVHAVDLLALP